MNLRFPICGRSYRFPRFSPWALVSAVVLSCSFVCGAAAAEPRLCAGSASVIKGRPELVAPVGAVFGRSPPSERSVDCAYPWKLLRYGDVDVLLVLAADPDPVAGDPEDAPCHGCAGVLSAYVLRRTPSGPRMSAAFHRFGSYGTWGRPGEISAVEIDGRDAILIGTGGSFQGADEESMSVVVFRDDRLDALDPAIPISASTGGDGGVVRSVASAWRVDGPSIVVDYLSRTAGRPTRSTVVWTIDGNRLERTSGAVPMEWDRIHGR